MESLCGPDLELIEVARQLIRSRYKADWHALACAVQTRSGRIHTGVHIECYMGRVTVCAEAVAIGRAATEGDGEDIETIVTVRQSSSGDETPSVVAPCGMCREMISDYAPLARVIVPGLDGPIVMPALDLIPYKYIRTD